MPTTPNSQAVGVVILNWNGAEYTKACLDSLAQLTHQPKTILLIDNGSQPTQAELLHEYVKKYPHLAVEILRLEENLGFAGGMNVGVNRLLQQPEIQYVWLLNNDTQVASSALDEMLRSFQNPKVGIVGARLMRASHQTQIENRGLGLSSWGLAWNITQQGVRPSLASAGCVLISRECATQVSQEVNLFDLRLFLYFEDVDFGLRALAQGWKVVQNDQAVVFHVGSASTKKNHNTALYYWHRNSIWVIWKNFPTLSLWIAVLPLFMLHLAVAALYTFKGNGGVIWKAKWDALKGLPQIISSRKNLKQRLTRKQLKSILFSNWIALKAWKQAR